MATTVNRYTQTQENRYQPRTLQELMLAPAYKRGKHDEMDASISEYETALAQFSGMDTHDTRLKEEQKKLYDKMTSQRDKLNEEGFSQSSKSDFIRFNKEYQKAIGPQGNIGQIQSAKDSFAKSRQQILDVAMKQGHDLQQSQAQIKKQKEIYATNFAETGEIKDFEGVLPPSYHDLDTDIKGMKAQLGHIIETELPKGTPYEILVDTSTGSPIIAIKTIKGQKLTKDNSVAIANANKALTDKWLTAGGAGYNSAEWNNMDQNTIRNAIKNGLQVMHVKEEKDTTQDSYSFLNPGKGENPDKVDPTKRMVVSTSASNAWANEGVDTKEDAIKQAEVLKASTNAADQAAGRRLDERVKLIEQEYRNTNPDITDDYKEAEWNTQTAYDNMINSTGGIFEKIQGGTPQDYTIASHADMAKYAANIGGLDLVENEETGEFTIYKSEGGVDSVTLAQGGKDVQTYFNTLTENAKVISAYQAGLNNKIQFEKNQDVKMNVEVFEKESDRTAYNNTMYSLITTHGLNDLKPLVAYSKEANTTGAHEKLDETETNNLLEIITNGEKSNFKFNGFIQQTKNGIPAIEVQYRIPGEKSKEDVVYTAQYELSRLGVDGTKMTGVNEAIIDTMKTYGGWEGEVIEKEMKQSITYKDLYPTFHEEDYSNAGTIKQSVMLRTSTSEELDMYGYSISDALENNGLIQNKFDISTENMGNKQQYSIKTKDSEGARRLTWADVIPDGDLSKIPPNVWPHIRQRIAPFMELKGITNSNAISDEDEKVFIDQLKNTNIYMDNYYDLLDLLGGK